jgi:hypothetical protein
MLQKIEFYITTVSFHVNNICTRQNLSAKGSGEGKPEGDKNESKVRECLNLPNENF